jgi:hypothetical protein
VWCGRPSRGQIGTFFFEAAVTGAAYLSVLQDNTVTSINNLFLEKKSYFRQDGALLRYQNDVKNFLNVNFFWKMNRP